MADNLWDTPLGPISFPFIQFGDKNWLNNRLVSPSSWLAPSVLELPYLSLYSVSYEKFVESPERNALKKFYSLNSIRWLSN